MNEFEKCVERFKVAIIDSLDDDKRFTIGLVEGLVDYVFRAQTVERLTHVKERPPKVEYVIVRGNAPIPKNPNKKARKSISGWSSIRRDILRRDESRCRICNKDYYLHVHHIDYNRKNNKECNLITLCESCHQAVHAEGYRPADHPDIMPPWNKTRKEYTFNQEKN